MLPKSARLIASEDFARATKSGSRANSENFAAYLFISPVTNSSPAKCGLIIGTNVGGSVTRHRIARKVRHALAGNLANLPEGSLLVIRALSKNTASQKAGALNKNISDEITQLVTKVLSRAADQNRKSAVI